MTETSYHEHLLCEMKRRVAAIELFLNAQSSVKTDSDGLLELVAPTLQYIADHRGYLIVAPSHVHGSIAALLVFCYAKQAKAVNDGRNYQIHGLTVKGWPYRGPWLEARDAIRAGTWKHRLFTPSNAAAWTFGRHKTGGTEAPS